MTMKYTKRPVTVDAIQWDATQKTWLEIIALGLQWRPGEMGSDSFYIQTLEGDMLCSKGDWVIKGVKGEFYPCKPDIFDLTYEKHNP